MYEYARTRIIGQAIDRLIVERMGRVYSYNSSSLSFFINIKKFKHPIK